MNYCTSVVLCECCSLQISLWLRCYLSYPVLFLLLLRLVLMTGHLSNIPVDAQYFSNFAFRDNRFSRLQTDNSQHTQYNKVTHYQYSPRLIGFALHETQVGGPIEGLASARGHRQISLMMEPGFNSPTHRLQDSFLHKLRVQLTGAAVNGKYYYQYVSWAMVEVQPLASLRAMDLTLASDSMALFLSQ